MASKRIGLIGAGLMGHGLGQRLLATGHPLSVLGHRNRQPIDDLVLRGATEASSAAELAANVEVVILCVSNSRVVAGLMAEMLPHLKPPTLVVDTGTSLPEESRLWANRLAALGVGFADCPLTGGPEQAREGKLGVLCGADAALLPELEPILSCFATTIRHMGPAGSGHTAKLISNYLVTGMIALVSEAFAAAAATGIDPASLFAAMRNGSGNSGVLQKMVEPALGGDFNGYKFAIANAAKDIGYYQELAESLGLSSALSTATAGFFAAARAKGDPERPVSALLRESLTT